MEPIRAASLNDVALMSRNVREGVAGYRAWAPDWQIPPSLGSEQELRAAFYSDGFSAYVNADVSAHSAAFRANDEPDAFHLFNLFLQPHRQGSGIAANLLARQVEDARIAGARLMRLRTPRGNTRAVRFYEREGWSVTGEAITSLALGLEHVWMRRRL